MVSLELLLAALLIATLAFGLRLERRLRALREGQEGFVKAMRELDGAAERTEHGLALLRDASQDAGALLPRIEAAKAAAARLEALTSAAERAAERAEAAAASVQASARELARAVPNRRSEPVSSAGAPVSRTPPRLNTPDFAAMLKPNITRQPLPSTPELEGSNRPAQGSRLREAAALLRGG